MESEKRRPALCAYCGGMIQREEERRGEGEGEEGREGGRGGSGEGREGEREGGGREGGNYDGEERKFL